MEENMKGNINMIKNMDMEFIFGLMEENMRGNGLLENNMEKVEIYLLFFRIILYIFLQFLKGKYILPDNNVKVGVWEDGKRVKWIENDE